MWSKFELKWRCERSCQGHKIGPATNKGYKELLRMKYEVKLHSNMMGMYNTCARTGVDDQNTCSCIRLKIGDFKQCSGGMVLSSQMCSYSCHNATLKVWSGLNCQRSCQA